jgi:cytochrome c biogenesis protein CcmG, thiol:disulfide interchange protein DsbE
MKKFLSLLILCVPLLLFSQEYLRKDSLIPKAAQDFYKPKSSERLPPDTLSSSDSARLPDTILEFGRENIGKSLPDFRSTSLNGESYSREILAGKVTFINFWFEHCPPCIAEFEALNDLYKRFKENKEFQFLSFTWEKKENALRVAQKYGLEYPIICLSPDSCRKLINNKYAGYPTNIITNKASKIQFFIIGGPKDSEEAEKVEQTIFIPKLEELLNNTKQ